MRKEIHDRRYLLVTAVCAAAAIAAYTVFHARSILREKGNRFSGQVAKKSSELLDAYPGRYTFTVADIDNPFLSLGENGDTAFIAASLIKVPIMVSVFFAAKEGRISLDDKVTVRMREVTGGSGTIKRGPFPVTLTVRELIRLMITQSDNTAANKLISLVGMDYINATFRKMGLTRSVLTRKILDFEARGKGVENYISCADLTRLFRKMCQGKLVDKRSSAVMLSFLLAQRFNDRIPRYLPETARVAHKSGLERDSVGDAGIVYTGCGDYVICMIASGFPDYKTAKDLIAKFSEVVYNAYTTGTDLTTTGTRRK